MSMTFAPTVNPPAPASYAPPPSLDFSHLFSDYTQGVNFADQQRVLNAFNGQAGSPNGLPTTDNTPNGPIDPQAMYRKLMSLGAYDQANQVLQTSIAQQGLKNTSDFNTFIRTGQMPGQSQPAASTPSPALASPSAAPVTSNAPGPQSDYNTNTGIHESGNGAASPNIYQFHQDTWDGIAAKHPELNLPATPDQATPAQQAQANLALAGNNGGQLAEAGLPVNDKTLYTAHFFGAPQAVKFLSALGKNAGQSAAALFPTEAADNPSVFYNADGSSKNLAQVYVGQTAKFSQANTTGIDFSGVTRPGAGGPIARAADGTPVATNAQGQAIDRTGQPTQTLPTGRPAVHITNEPTGSAIMTAPDGTSMAVPASRSPAVGALSTALAARAAQDGGTVPGGAATSTGGAAAANAARVAASQTPSNGTNVGQLGPLGPPGSGTQAPAQIAHGDTSAPADRSSYAENLATPPASNPMGRAPGGAGATPSPPTQPAPPPVTAPTGSNSVAPPSLTAGSSIDPTLGGAVPKPFADGLIARGVDPSQVPGTWARYLTSMASSPGISKEAADSYRGAAQQVLETLRQANTPNPALKLFEATREIDPATGQPETFAVNQARTTAAAEKAKLDVQNQNTLEKTTPVAGGPEVFDTRAHLLKAIAAGTAGPNASVGPGAGASLGGPMPSDLPVAQQPAFIAEKQAQIAKGEDQMMQQYQNRQIAKERLGELADLTEKFQTGNLAGAYAEVQGLSRAMGMPIPNSNQMNAAAYQEFTKNAIANVFNQAKDYGSRILVSEIQGLTKSNANAELQPEAAAKIIAQGAGILNFEDKHFEEYHAWKNQNPNAYDTSGFEIPFIKSNPVKQYTDQALQQIAPLGAEQPKSPADLKIGQVYQSPNGHGIGRWNGKQLITETRPASQRLFQPVMVTP
jgi:hypothetical protein